MAVVSRSCDHRRCRLRLSNCSHNWRIVRRVPTRICCVVRCLLVSGPTDRPWSRWPEAACGPDEPAALPRMKDARPCQTVAASRNDWWRPINACRTPRLNNLPVVALPARTLRRRRRRRRTRVAWNMHRSIRARHRLSYGTARRIPIRVVRATPVALTDYNAYRRQRPSSICWRSSVSIPPPPRPLLPGAAAITWLAFLVISS